MDAKNNIPELYGNLTGVDIEQQKKLWDERGKGYFGEYLVFSRLFNNIPGQGKILMNLKLPGVYGVDTEVDLIFIHETGIYVFEIKHYKGTIYGKTTDEKWTQYFRTAPNHSFYNPVRQNAGHIAALKKITNDLPITSFIVFTNDDVSLQITGAANAVHICELYRLEETFFKVAQNKPMLLTIDHIDSLFNRLKVYAPIKENKPEETAVIPLYQYAANVRANLEEMNKKILNKRWCRAFLCACAVALVVFLINFIPMTVTNIVSNNAFEKQLNERAADIDTYIASEIEQYKTETENAKQKAKNAESKAKSAEEKAKNAEREKAAAVAAKEEMANKFKTVEGIDKGNFELPDDFLTVSEFSIIQSNNVKNAVEIKATINVNNEIYSIKLTDATKITVILKDGSAQEYNFFEVNPVGATKNSSVWGFFNIGRWQNCVLPELNKKNIANIKLTGISLCKRNDATTIGSETLSLGLYGK